MSGKSIRWHALLVGCVLGMGRISLGQINSVVLFPLSMSASQMSVGQQARMSASGGQVAGSWNEGTTSNAILWTLSGAVDLDPTGTTGSNAYGDGGGQQVGVVRGDATLWTGSAASAVNLMPTVSGYYSSVAFATNGSQQVGYLSAQVLGDGSPGFVQTEAVVWSGTAASAVQLGPSWAISSEAYGLGGGQEVGYVTQYPEPEVAMAAVWNGDSNNAIVLQPTGYGTSTALGTNGTQQVGEGQLSGSSTNHALLWNGSSTNYVDLNPTNLAGVNGTEALATNGTQQVGNGNTASGELVEHEALLWSGTAASVVNLQALLPSGSWIGTTATSIDSSGDVFGTAQGTYNGVTGDFAVEWQQTPAVAWSSAVSGSWQGSGNWSPIATPAEAISATFSAGSATPYTVTLSSNSSASSINVQDNVTIQKVGFNLSVPGAVSISGTVNQNASLALAGGGSNTFGSLSISNGQLDITDNTVTINYGAGNLSPVGSVGAYVASGYKGGAWNGAGIVSSKVAAVNATLGNPNAYAIGYADASDPAVAADGFTPGTVVIEPAIVGDANLDGVVNFSDFQLLAASFNQPNTSWDQGNFDYGAGTNFSDFQLLAANFNDSTSLDAAELDAMNQFAKGFGDTLVPNADGIGFTIVPEPVAGLMLVIFGAGVCLRRGRRRGNDEC